MPQTKHEIQAILAAAGIRPLKRFGQHFLIDGNLMTKLVAEAGIRPADTVLEVGPGTGSLTELLLAAAGHVVAVEIDRGLHAVLEKRLISSGNLTLLHIDILESKSRIAAPVLAALGERQAQLGGRIMLVANLPYDVATPLIVDLLVGELAASPLCFTVQAEVAERMMAPAGGREYGPLSIMVQALGEVRRIARIPPEAFWPMPKVDSAMMRIERRDDEAAGGGRQATLGHIVHSCFNHRRKTLRWSLQKAVSEATFAAVEAKGRWDLSLRPERLTVADWVALAQTVSTFDPA